MAINVLPEPLKKTTWPRQGTPVDRATPQVETGGSGVRGHPWQFSNTATKKREGAGEDQENVIMIFFLIHLPEQAVVGGFRTEEKCRAQASCQRGVEAKFIQLVVFL